MTGKENVKMRVAVIVPWGGNGGVQAGTCALIQTAREIADSFSGEVFVLWCERERTGEEERLGAYGADRVVVLKQDREEGYWHEREAEAFYQALSIYRPGIILAEAGFPANDLAARLAVHLGAGLVTDAVSAEAVSGSLVIKRPSNEAGKMTVYTCDMQMVQMATISPSGVDEGRIDPERKAKVSLIVTEGVDERTTPVLLSGTSKPHEGVDIRQAKYLVAGGRGAGGPEGFRMLGELAKLLGGSIAASRPNVDEGWIGKEYQVGLSGKKVCPDLYFAFGISGSAHHVVGMEESKVVIAVNMDRNAPIFDVSDYGIVGDVGEILPLFIRRLSEMRGRSCSFSSVNCKNETVSMMESFAEKAK